MNIAIGVLAGFLSGVAGAMGLGGGSVLLIYLTVFAGCGQIQAQGINLWFFLPTAAIAVAIYTKRGLVNWKQIFPLMVAGVITTLVASIILRFIDPNGIKTFFGALLLVYGVTQVFFKSKKQRD